MQDIKVRQAHPEDAAAIDVVNRSAFGGEAEAQMVTAVNSSQSYVPELSLVAEVGGRVTGHIMLFRAQLERQGKQHEVLALAPMAVVPSHSHRGTGSLLLRAAVAKATSLGYKAIVVVGHPDYYTRFDFQPASKWEIRCPLSVPAESVTAQELVAGVLEGGGTLRYPAEFTRLFANRQAV